jgi:hypothetical protein
MALVASSIYPSAHVSLLHKIEHWPTRADMTYPDGPLNLITQAVALSAMNRLCDEWFYWIVLPAGLAGSLMWLIRNRKNSTTRCAILVSVLCTVAAMILLFISGAYLESCFMSATYYQHVGATSKLLECLSWGDHTIQQTSRSGLLPAWSLFTFIISYIYLDRKKMAETVSM